ncbi:MAG TPA: HD domain-containing protein [Erysipelotrichaceae bacterium]|nr:HD domain-containing protein [Erysipelotrichaceae bacterium]
MKMIAELEDREQVEGQFLLGNVSKGINVAGVAYYSLELRDASGTINAKKWDAKPEDDQVFISGNVISVIGETNTYRDQLQVKISSAELVPLEEIDEARFTKFAPVSKEELIKRFNDHVASIKNQDCLKILNYMLEKYKDKLFSFPAAVSIHHDYSSGLLMHSVTMADIAKFLCPIYEADHDLVVTGCLLHDLGKTIELEGPIVYRYSLEGRLLGHISIMCAELKIAAEQLDIQSEVPLLLQHMILSHHGQLEFGSPILPLTKEAMLLSLIDNLDSKMVVVDKAISEIDNGEFTARVYSLDNRSLYKPK